MWKADLLEVAMLAKKGSNWIWLNEPLRVHLIKSNSILSWCKVQLPPNQLSTSRLRHFTPWSSRVAFIGFERCQYVLILSAIRNLCTGRVSTGGIILTNVLCSIQLRYYFINILTILHSILNLLIVYVHLIIFCAWYTIYIDHTNEILITKCVNLLWD